MTDPSAAVGGRVTRDARVPAADVADLVRDLDLDGPGAVMLLALPAATALADPPISGYHVGAVGLEAETGDLLLGANLEFPGTDLTRTVHAEGSVAIRSFLRGTTVTTLAIRSARPCAFCRQVLSEFAWAPSLRIIDPDGSDRGLDDVYPWPFTPGDLGAAGATPGRIDWPDLGLDDSATTVPADVAAALIRHVRSAHAPYSRCPAALVLRLRDGRLVGGSTIESVAFDPTIGPAQAALVAARAEGAGYADIDAAWLTGHAGAVVDDLTPSRALLGAVAPSATVTFVALA